MKKEFKNLITAAKGNMGEILAEDAAPVLTEEMLKGTALEFATEFIGAISPRIGGIMIAYKQKRWEHNWEIYIKEIIAKQEEINIRLDKLEKEQLRKFKRKIFPIVSDYVSNEKQEEKIKFIVNGFLNLAKQPDLREDIIIMYYDTLEQINLLDIRVLKSYVEKHYPGDSSGEALMDIMEDCNIDAGQMNLIREKLARLGLIESRNDADIDNNIREISEYLQAVEKGKKRKLKLKKISKNESYRATLYGRRFIEFFMKNSQKE